MSVIRLLCLVLSLYNPNISVKSERYITELNMLKNKRGPLPFCLSQDSLSVHAATDGKWGLLYYVVLRVI